MDEADVKTNKNEIEFNSFCLFLSFNFILVVFEVAEKYGHETLEFGKPKEPPGIIRLFVVFVALILKGCLAVLYVQVLNNRYLKTQNGVKEAIMD